MKIKTAVQILKTDLIVPGSVDTPHFQEAEQLSIEALKALDDCRKGDCTYHEELLPGETES